jgi:class 3 adenylate cyclase
MIDYDFSHSWQVESSSTPEQLWPILSDTNRLFRDLGELPVEQTNLTHNSRKGYRELTYEPLHRTDMWEEEPYQWEKPYHLSVKRNYKSGYLKELLISVDINPMEQGSVVTYRFRGETRRLTGYMYIKWRFNSRFKFRLRKLIQSYDQSISGHCVPQSKKRRFALSNPRRWDYLIDQLSDISREREISTLLIRMIQTGHESDLKQINPMKLSTLWNKPLSSVLRVMLFASKLDILNFSWKVLCPHCRTNVKNIKKLKEITDPVYCTQCEEDFNVDFHQGLELTFQPHPLVRKIPKKTYCFGNPAEQYHLDLNITLNPGQKRFVKINLSEGRYRIYSDKSEEVIRAEVDENGLSNATIHFRKNRTMTDKVYLSTAPNLIIHNQTDEVMIIRCENVHKEKFTVSAAEVSSWQLFRNLFPEELIRDKKKLNAENLTILFTDLYNSSDLYRKDGDESAIGVVMDHFDVLEQAIIEERGSVVKTIGDSVMAIFPKPANAMRAFYKADQIFKENTDHDPPIELKGGIHTGDCMAVTLNNRIDYFGNTVNVASRLVGFAGGSEVVISSEAYSCTELKDYVRTREHSLKKHFREVTFKGFENESFEILQMSHKESPLRLVV